MIEIWLGIFARRVKKEELESLKKKQAETAVSRDYNDLYSVHTC